MITAWLGLIFFFKYIFSISLPTVGNDFILRRWTIFSGPLWGPNLISFYLISWGKTSFLDFNLQTVSAHFWPLHFLNVTDGGWMDGWVPKMFSDFAHIFFRWSSGDINVGKFGKSAKNFFYQKKILLQLPKSGGFLVEKKVLWLCSNFGHIKFTTNECAQFSSFVTSAFLLEQNPISSLKFCC